MPISSGVRAILGVFGPLYSAAVEGGRGAANLWSTYRNAYANLGREAPPATIQDMNLFAAGLGGIQRSAQALAAAPDEYAFTGEMYAPPIGYEPSGADFAVPSMLVTFEAHIETAEGLVTRWSSISYNASFPTTVGELRLDAVTSVQSQLDEAAMEEGAESPTAGGQVVGLGQMYALAKGLG